MAPRSSVEDLALSGLSSRQFLSAQLNLTKVVQSPEGILVDYLEDAGEHLMASLLGDLDLDLVDDEAFTTAGGSVVSFLSATIIHMVARGYEQRETMTEAEYVASLVKRMGRLDWPIVRILEPDLQEVLHLLTGHPMSLPRGLMVGQLLALAVEEDQVHTTAELTLLDAAIELLMAIQDSM